MYPLGAKTLTVPLSCCYICSKNTLSSSYKSTSDVVGTTGRDSGLVLVLTRHVLRHRDHSAAPHPLALAARIEEST